MVAFVLHDPGMKALGDALDGSPVQTQTAISDVRRAFDPAPQAWDRQAALPPALDRSLRDLDDGIDEDGQRRRVIESLGLAEPRIRARGGGLKDDDAQAFVHLRRRETRAVGVDHGFDHVFDQAPDLGVARIGNFDRALGKHRMTHARNFSNSHGVSYATVPGHGQGWTGRGPSGITRALGRPGEAASGWIVFLEVCLQIIVRDNNVDQALKALKKKMQREGLFREMKLRNHYEKPSERRAREKAEAIRRARKLQRKKMQREGLLPRTK